MGWESGIKEDRRELDTAADMYVPLVAKGYSSQLLMNSEQYGEKVHKHSDSGLIPQTRKLIYKTDFASHIHMFPYR